MTYGMTNDITPGAPGGLASFDIKPFQTVLLNELVPYVDSHFRTRADARHRAMAGLSMGGFEAKLIASANLDKFSYIGLFSGGTYSLDDVNKIPGFKEKAKLVFVSFGSRELEPGRRNTPPGISAFRSPRQRRGPEGRRLQQRVLRLAQYRARVFVLAAQSA